MKKPKQIIHNPASTLRENTYLLVKDLKQHVHLLSPTLILYYSHPRQPYPPDTITYHPNKLLTALHLTLLALR